MDAATELAPALKLGNQSTGCSQAYSPVRESGGDARTTWDGRENRRWRTAPSAAPARGAHSQPVSRKQAQAPAGRGFCGSPYHQVARATAARSGILLVAADVCSLNATFYWSMQRGIRPHPRAQSKCSSTRSRPQYQRQRTGHDYEGALPDVRGERRGPGGGGGGGCRGLAGVPDAEKGSDVDLGSDLETEGAPGQGWSGLSPRPRASLAEVEGADWGRVGRAPLSRPAGSTLLRGAPSGQLAALRPLRNAPGGTRSSTIRTCFQSDVKMQKPFQTA